ncbi:FadR/GntR family transcriptional regulator [Microbacterium timonense]|uniref:FadR/GntR family transcriptional regulator n=1 Tax=Microbacterium timonense TaxID=2086576 RepID=UPI000D114614|nr:GntR family transcriptional regulator [Microbacterium timonense]
MFTPDRVRRPREQVEKQLRDAIVSGTFKKGERLPSEATLAQDFQVSRTTVREALRVLVSEGLISKVPGAGGGSFVQNVDHDSLRNLLSGSLETILKFGALTLDEVTVVRRLLEVPAARLAADHRTPEQAAELQTLIARQDAIVADSGRDSRDPEQFEIGQSIYTIVGEASGNRLLGSFIAAISQVTIGVYMRELPADEAEQAREVTRSLVDAIVAGDADLAEETMATALGQIEDRHRLAASRADR